MSELLSQLQQLGDGEIDDLSIAHDASEEIVALRLRVAELEDRCTDQSPAMQGEPVAWSGWGCQYPGKMPRLYGDRRIAELNCDTENGDQVLYFTAALKPAEQSVCPVCNGEGLNPLTEVPVPCVNCHGERQPAPDVQAEPVGYIRKSTLELMKSDELGVLANIIKEPRCPDCVAIYTAPQPAAEVLAKGYFHPLPDENDYEFHDAEQFPDGSNCPACVPAVIVRRSAVANQPAPDVAGLVDALVACARASSAAEVGLIVDAALAAHRRGGGK